MKYVKPPYYMTAQLLAELMDCDIRAAADRLTMIRKHYDKFPRAFISLKQYCDYEQTPLADNDFSIERFEKNKQYIGYLIKRKYVNLKYENK